MGIVLTVKGSDFSNNAIGFLPPVKDGLEYWNYFGGNASRTGRNLAPLKSAAQVVGAPAIGAGYATFQTVTNFVQTPVLDQRSVTLLAVARAPNLVDGVFGFTIASYNNSGAGANLMFDISSKKPQVFDARNNNTVTAYTTDASNRNAFGFYAARSSDTYSQIDDKTVGASAGGNLVAVPRAASNGSYFRVGSYDFVGASAPFGLVDVAFAAIYSRVLSDGEIADIYDRVRAYEATVGIAV